MGLNKRLIGAGATASGALTPSENFKVVLYDGNSSTQSITGVGFKPDFVWIKERDKTEFHRLFDSTRGATKYLGSDNNNAEGTGSATLTSFDSDGFTLGLDNEVNDSGSNYVAWCWKANGGTTASNSDGSVTSTVQANQDSGFSIVKWDGTGAINTVGHGLSSAPELILNKGLDSTADWQVYSSVTGNGNKLALNTNAASSSTTRFDSTSPTSSVFTLRDVGLGTGQIAYCFHSVDSFSKFGSYTGNGSTNGPIVETGFEPAFIMVKRYNTVSDWVIYDNKRNTTNPRFSYIRANTTTAETGTAGDAAPQLDFLSNGFQPSGTEGYVNANGDSYLYMAFAADPDTEAPTLADSFNIKTYTGNASNNSVDIGFDAGLTWIKNRTDTGSYHILFDKVRGLNRVIHSNLTNAEQGSNNNFEYNDGTLSFDGSTTWGNKSGSNYVAWAWKADDNEPTIFGGAAKAVYKFEDNANDVTGTYNGTASNVSYATGNFNKAADFSTSGANIAIGSVIPNTDTAVSVSAWVYLNSSGNTNDNGTVIGTGITSAGSEGPFRVNLRYVSANTYKITALRQVGGTYYLSADSNIIDSTVTHATWHHVVWTYNPSGRTLTTYLNGSKVQSTEMTTSGSSVNDSTSVIGNFRGNTTTNFNGLIDQVRIYNGVVSDVGVAALYAETVSDNDDLTLGGPPEIIISANANAGFSIVKYEGDGTSGRRIPHGLSAAPELIIAKANITSSWVVYSSATGTDKFLELNQTNTETSSSNYWGTSSPSATTFGVAPSNSNNNSTGNEVFAYCFHSVSGYSKIGSYTGNGNSTGPTVTTGFQPDLVIIKKTDSAGYSWYMFDSVRDGNNPKQTILKANSDGAEFTVTNSIEFNATSFQPKNTDPGWNESGATYIYMAFKIN